MKTISSTHHHQHFDKSLPPVATVAPGADVAFETLDACYGEVHSVEDFEHYRRQPSRGGDPVTGPVYVEGARPGDTLVVQIRGIEVSSPGFQLIGPDRAIIRDEIRDWTLYEVAPFRNQIRLSNGLEFPAKPVIGCFGNAPAGTPTWKPNPLGGNCDVPAVRAGCALYLPIEVPGALFSLGDVHARQGDGEVVGAPEIGARVTAHFEIEDGRRSEWFMIEDSASWHSAIAAESEAEAARQAVFQNARFIERSFSVAFKDALIILTMIGRLSISLTGKWGDTLPVVCSSFSKQALRDALAHYNPGIRHTLADP